MFKLFISGSRSLTDYSIVQSAMKPYERRAFDEELVILHGGARGADALASKWAVAHNVKQEIYLPEWERLGKSAGIIRNNHMALNCDALIAFWDTQSRGTLHSIQRVGKLKKPVKIVTFIS